MSVLDSIDVDLTWDGDLQVGDDGDLKTNSDDYIRATETAVQNIVKADFGDWDGDPTFAANLSDFIGEPNNRENGQKIAQRVKSRIVAMGIAEASDITVRVVPIGIHEVAILVKVDAASTSGNRLQPGESLVVSTLFDSNEGEVLVLPRSQKERLGV